MIERITTANGAEILGFPNPALHSFCLCLYVKAGPLYETPEENGISHFFEHMAFRGINAAMDGSLYRAADKLGITMNAVTYKEFIQFRITGASENFKESAAILCRIFTPFRVPMREIEIERRRIKSELRESDEKNSLEYFSQKIVWKDTTLSGTILGKHKNLDRFGAGTLAKAQQTLLSVNNLFFCVTGNYGKNGLDDLAKLLEEAPLCVTAEKRTNTAPVPGGFGKRNAAIHIKNSREHVVRFSFDMESARYTTAEQYLLYDLLFSGECSKFFRGLSDDSGMVYSYDAAIEKYNNIGTVSFLYEIGAADVLRSVEKVTDILCDLKKGVTDELDYCRPVYVTGAEMLLDEPEELNFQIGYEARIMEKPFLSLEERKAAFCACTPARMTEIVREVFTPDHLVLTFKENAKRLDIEKVQSIISRL